MASNSTWTFEQNKRFEKAIAMYDNDAPDFWHNLAKATGGKTVEEVKRHYEQLEEDIELIEAGKPPKLNFFPFVSSDTGCSLVDDPKQSGKDQKKQKKGKGKDQKKKKIAE